tara:strand:- start:9575 stop:9763 length:189 start_codon:yes stop_codon:yes gene_type:complete
VRAVGGLERGITKEEENEEDDPDADKDAAEDGDTGDFDFEEELIPTTFSRPSVAPSKAMSSI